MSLDESLPYTLVAFMIIFVQVSVPPVSYRNSGVFISYFPFCISGYNIVTNLEHAKFFNSVPNGSRLLNTNEYCYSSPLGGFLNFMLLVNSSSVFSTPKSIFLRDLLNTSMIPSTLQKVSVPFYGGGVIEHFQKA